MPVNTAAFRELLGDSGWLDEASQMQPYLKEWRGRYQGQAVGVARPTDTEQTAAV